MVPTRASFLCGRLVQLPEGSEIFFEFLDAVLQLRSGPRRRSHYACRSSYAVTMFEECDRVRSSMDQVRQKRAVRIWPLVWCVADRLYFHSQSLGQLRGTLGGEAIKCARDHAAG